MARGWTAENSPLPEEQPRKRKKDGPISTKRAVERAVLVAALPRKDVRLERDDPLEELAALAKTAGVEVVEERVVQRRDRLDPATCVGKGTVTTVGELMELHQAGCVIFDNELRPAQRRNLEKRLGKKVIDRTELILDIFASHARTPQSRLQVEVAQLEYSLPRLRRMWSHLDPGIGLRGPGEKQLEIDKRLIRLRIQELKRELGTLRARKEREVKTRSEVFRVALVGYTNAGKSTLMNRLTTADVYVADKLFATLDTRTRPWKVGGRRSVLLSDTVGFISHLPHRLVESFHATLEEVVTSDLLLHVVDASDVAPEQQIEAVHEVLKSLGLEDHPEVMVLNKVDACAPELIPYLERRFVDTLRVSALTGEGIDALRAAVNSHAASEENDYRLTINVREGKAIACLEGYTEILEKTLNGETLEFSVQCRPQVLAAVRSRLLKPAEFVVVESDREEDVGGDPEED